MPSTRGTPAEIWGALQALKAGRSYRDVGASLRRGAATVRSWEIQYAHFVTLDDLQRHLQPPTRYIQIMSALFAEKCGAGVTEFEWDRSDIRRLATAIGVPPPDNLGDNVYSIRHGREELPAAIKALAPPGMEWILLPNGKSSYRFATTKHAFLDPDRSRRAIKIPDSTPQIVARYAKRDEQAVLARIRYCRLVDIFMGLASYQLQSHMRTTVTHFQGAQTELDEVYVGVDRNGTQFVVPIQAKSPDERIGAVQIITDHYACAEKFPGLVARTVAAQTVSVEEAGSFGEIYTIALVEARVEGGRNVEKVREEHFRLVPAAMITDADLSEYRMLYTP